jgi:peptide/nickel transport system substrate-binding protein
MRKPWARAATLVAAVALAVSGCTSAGQADPVASPSDSSGDDGTSAAEPAGTLSVAAFVDNNTWDSRDLRLGHYYMYWQAVYDTLLLAADDGTPEPNLATDWSYNDDNTVLTLTLRDDVTFTDGTAFDGEAVKANVEYLAAGTGQNAYMAQGVDVVVNSPTEVELHIAAPNPALVYYLSATLGVMASPAAIAAGTLVDAPVGSGPYVLSDETVAASKYVFTPNPDYWNKDAYPYDRYEVTVMSDLTPRLNALKTGQVNAGLLAPSVAAEAEGSNVSVLTSPNDWAGLVIADRNGTILPELADVRVRQAINYAIDRDALLEGILLGYGTSTSQAFGESNQAFDSSLDDYYTYDPDKARDLLEEAGVTSLTLEMPELNAPYSAIYPLLKQELADVGITLNSFQVPPDQLITELRSGKYPVFFMSLGSAQAWRDIQTWFIPTAPWSPNGSTDPELEQLINEAQMATPGDEQDEAFQAVNTWIVENAWLAPFWRVDTLWGTTAETTTTMQSTVVVPNLRSYHPSGS